MQLDMNQGVLLDNNYKLIATSVKEKKFVLYFGMLLSL